MKRKLEEYKWQEERFQNLSTKKSFEGAERMTNREKLLHTNLYDLLLKMHEYMMNKAPSCVLEPLGKKCDVTVGTCDDCIAKWLNEEVN